VVSFAEQLWAIPPSGINCLLSNPDAGRKDRRAMPATTIDPGPAARFAAGFVALFAAHNLADYWSQTYSQATNKARRGDPHENRAGRSAALAHIATYTAISTSAVSAANRVLGLGASPRGIVAGQLISVASHYFSDRRHPLRELAARTGRLQFHDSGVQLAYQLADGRHPGHRDSGGRPRTARSPYSGGTGGRSSGNLGKQAG
jgi:hypothetical protein